MACTLVACRASDMSQASIALRGVPACREVAGQGSESLQCGPSGMQVVKHG